MVALDGWPPVVVASFTALSGTWGWLTGSRWPEVSSPGAAGFCSSPVPEHCGECNCEAELRRIIELQAELAWTHSVLAYLAGIIVLGCILVLWVLGCGSLCCCCSRLGVGSGNKPKPGIALPDRSPSPVPWSQTRRPGPVRPSDLSDGR